MSYCWRPTVVFALTAIEPSLDAAIGARSERRFAAHLPSRLRE